MLRRFAASFALMIVFRRSFSRFAASSAAHKENTSLRVRTSVIIMAFVVALLPSFSSNVFILIAD
jgi:hypothetical protein